MALRNQIIFDGDSLTVNSGNVVGGNYPTQFQNLMNAPANGIWYYWNIGIGGQRLTTMLANAPTNIDRLYTTPATRNVVFIWAGTNDINGGDSAATVYANMRSYGNARKAVGFTVIIIDVTPAQNRPESVRSAYNGLLTADFNGVTGFTNIYTPKGGVTYGDLLIDVGGDPNIGCPTCNLNLTYFVDDQVHMQVAGYEIVAIYALDAMKALGFIP